MAADEIHVGDVGTQFTITIKDGSSAVDISSATTKQIIFKKPDGTTLTVNATFISGGTSGQMQYTTLSGNLSVAGTWKLQAYLVLTGWTGRTDISTFDVHCNLV